MTARRSLRLLAAALGFAAAHAHAQGWLETRAEIEDLHAAGDIGGVEARGDRYIEDVRGEFGADSLRSAEALLELADLEMQLALHPDAADSFLSAIDVLTPLDTPESTRLIDAWVLLGENYLAADLHALAIQSFEQAQDLSRRKFGLYNEDQIGIIYRMSRAALDTGDMEAVVTYRQEASDIFRRGRLQELQSAAALKTSDPDQFLDARLDYAEALLAEGLIGDAIRSYGETLEIIEDDFGKSNRLRAQVLLAQASAAGANLAVLQRARRTINFMAEPDPELRAELRREWGDWRLMVGLTDKAERAYRESWRLLESIEGGEDLQREWYGEPQFINEARHGLISDGLLTLAPDAPAGQVVLEFIINQAGRASNISVVSAEPQWMAGIAVRHVQGSLFRPRFSDGDLIVTPGRFVWSFRYDPEVAASYGLTPMVSQL